MRMAPGLAGAGGHEQEVPAVGQEERPGVAGLAARAIEEGDRLRGPARCPHAPDRIGGAAVEEDPAAPAPRAVVAAGRVADGDGGPPATGDLAQLPLGDERQPPAVGRPEGPGVPDRSPPAHAPRGRRAAAPRCAACRPSRRRGTPVSGRRARGAARRRRSSPAAEPPRSGRRADARVRAGAPSRPAPATASASTPPASHASRSRPRRRRATDRRRHAGRELPSAIQPSSSFTSCAVWMRSSGSLARQAWMSWSSAGGGHAAPACGERRRAPRT